MMISCGFTLMQILLNSISSEIPKIWFGESRVYADIIGFVFQSVVDRLRHTVIIAGIRGKDAYIGDDVLCERGILFLKL